MADTERLHELERRVREDPASIAFAALAEEYRREGRYLEAIETCHAGLEYHPAYLSARVTLGRALVELQQLDEAQAEFDQVLKSAPENLAAVKGLGEVYQRRGQLVDALAQYRVALELARHDPELQDTVDRMAKEVDPDRSTEPSEGLTFEQARDLFLEASGSPAAETASEDRGTSPVAQQPDPPAEPEPVTEPAAPDRAEEPPTASASPAAEAGPDPSGVAHALPALETFLEAVERDRAKRRDPQGS